MLHITNFSKKYPGNSAPVLEISRFETGAGTYWIKGDNGSGKTSLLKSIAGLVPYDGNIKVEGLDIEHSRMNYSRIVNYAEAEPKYPPFLYGKDLIDFYTQTKGGHFPVALSAGLGVDKFMHQKTSTYSSGMLKKLSLVLAFTGNPKLVLLDEPLVALDVAAVNLLQSAIRQYFLSGVSFLVTSHQALDTQVLTGTINLLLENKTLRREPV